MGNFGYKGEKKYTHASLSLFLLVKADHGMYYKIECLLTSQYSKSWKNCRVEISLEAAEATFLPSRWEFSPLLLGHHNQAANMGLILA